MEEQNNIYAYKIAIALLTEGITTKGVDILDIPSILREMAEDYEKEIEFQTK